MKRTTIGLALLTLSLFPAAAQAQSKEPRLSQTKVLEPQALSAFQNWGFELGSLQGWTETGTAFDSQPTLDNNVAARRPGIDLNHQGNFWVGTFENRPDEAAPFGRTQGDERTGRLISPEFTVEKRYITFLLGGGRGSAASEVLMVRLMGLGPDGRAAEIKADAGWDQEEMQRVVWDVYAVRGKRARIEIIDEAVGPWGHLNVDDFQFTDVAPVNARSSEDSPTPTTPAVPRRGKFLVTVNGFVATEQTWDDATQRDGKDDEVFLIGETRILKTREGIPEITTLPQVRSVVMGDRQGFEDRAGAGSASALGGIRSGDRVPRTDRPWIRQRAPQTRGLPLILWQGELVADAIAAVIVPTIWEWDGQESIFAPLLRKLDVAEQWFGASLVVGVDDRTGNRAGASLLRRASELQVGQNIVGTTTSYERSGVVGLAGDRPIGLSWNADARAFSFDPWTLPLTYDKALRASETDYGRGPGVVEVNYFDPTELRGRYTLYLQIEKLR